MNLNSFQKHKKIQANFKCWQTFCRSLIFSRSALGAIFALNFLLFFFSPVCNNLAWGQSVNGLPAQTQTQHNPQNSLKNNGQYNGQHNGQQDNAQATLKHTPQHKAEKLQHNLASPKPIQVAGVENFYQVNHWLYRSAQPDAEGFKNIEAMGIKTVINLRDTNSDPKAALGTKLVLLNPGITTWSFTDDDIIKALCAVTHAQRPVLVHCRHGADRTGLIIALIRIIDEGWSVEDAKKEMLEGGYGFHSIWKNIPKYLDNVDINALKEKI